MKELKIFPELFRIGGCKEEKSEVRLRDAIVTMGGGGQEAFKFTILFEGIHLFKHLGKTGRYTLLPNKNTLCSTHDSTTDTLKT